MLPEKGHVWPGMLLVGADSHTCTHGAFGAFATGIGSTDMGAALGTGKLWFKVPETIRVEVNGQLAPRVAPKDVVLKTAKEIGADGATYMAIEFGGETIRAMSMAGRMTLCNMAIEMGGKTGIVEPDRITDAFLRDRVRNKYKIIKSDPNAEYAKRVEIDASALEPQVACPHAVDNVKDVTKVAGTKVDQVFIGSCTNGRVEDLEEAAKILKGKRISRDVRLMVTPRSFEVYDEANSKGIIKVLMDAGGVVCNPSCGACFGGNNGVIAPGEVSLSTSNRNFRGRQGSTEGFVYLCSPATAAASALTGVISDPREVKQMKIKGKAWNYGDNINTDFMLPGKYLEYTDPKELAKHAMEGIDPSFAKKVQKGDIVVGGKNMGLGSSREHAPIALKHAGVGAVVAESFARIFYRNSFNVGLAAIECPGISKVKTGDDVEIDTAAGTDNHQREGEAGDQAAPRLHGAATNEGGLVPYLKAHMKEW